MESRKRNVVIILVLLLLGISIGYAALSTTLNINGSSRINNATWNVFWDNVQVTTGSVTASTPVIDSSKTTVSYDITLNNPGDFYEFTVDAKNTGSIDAMIETISSKLNGVEITSSNLPVYLDYSLTYANGQAIEPNHLLASGNTLTYKIRIEFKREIESSQLPTTPQVLSFTFGATYVQKTGSAIPVTNGVTVYTAIPIHSWDEVYIGSPISSGIALFNNAEDAFTTRAQLSSSPYSLVITKHTVVDNIVTENYLVFKITTSDASRCAGSHPGIYSLRAGVNESSLTEKPIFEANKSVLLTAFGSNQCSDDGYGMGCECEGLNGGVFNNGDTMMNDNYGGCAVDSAAQCEGVYDY